MLCLMQNQCLVFTIRLKHASFWWKVLFWSSKFLSTCEYIVLLSEEWAFCASFYFYSMFWMKATELLGLDLEQNFKKENSWFCMLQAVAAINKKYNNFEFFSAVPNSRKQVIFSNNYIINKWVWHFFSRALGKVIFYCRYFWLPGFAVTSFFVTAYW